MYINHTILKSRALSLEEFTVLQLCKQARIEDVSDLLREYSSVVESLYNKELISPIKGKKGDDTWTLWRTTKKGLECLDLVTTPDVTDGDLQLYQYLCEMYLEEDSTRTLGNRKAGLIYSSQFRQIMGFSLHEAFYLYEMFISNVTFTKVLEYIFFSKKENPYKKFKDSLNDSKIFQFWEDNEFEIREYWANKIKTE